MKKNECMELIRLMMANFPAVVNNQNYDPSKTLDLFMLVFGKVEYSVMKMAIAKVLLTAKFFPTVAELQEAIENLDNEQSGIPTAEEAWQEVMKKLDYYKYPKFSHELIEQAVKTMGYRNLCVSENVAVDRGQFIKIYNNLKTREHEKSVNKKILSVVGNCADKLTFDKRKAITNARLYFFKVLK